MAVAGIYPIGERGPQLSDAETALLASLPDQARTSRPATHDELRTAIMQMAERHDYTLIVEMNDTGFVAVVSPGGRSESGPLDSGGTLRVIANQRGSGEETFYCQGESDALLRQLAEEIARACGPQLLLPVDGDDGVLVVARS